MKVRSGDAPQTASAAKAETSHSGFPLIFHDRISNIIEPFQISHAPAACQHGLRTLLRLDQLIDLILDSALTDELVHQNIARLPDPERPIGCLILDGRIPPTIEMHHMRGGGQMQRAVCAVADSRVRPSFKIRKPAGSSAPRGGGVDHRVMT
jgi:hypothetical protein